MLSWSRDLSLYSMLFTQFVAEHFDLLDLIDLALCSSHDILPVARSGALTAARVTWIPQRIHLVTNHRASAVFRGSRQLVA